MSVDFDTDLAAEVKALGGDTAVRKFKQNKIQDTIIRFRGFHYRTGASKAIQERALEAKPGADADKLSVMTQRLIAKPWDRKYDEMIRTINGDAAFDASHDVIIRTFLGDAQKSQFPAALDIVKTRFDARGKLIIAGESLGGANALDFCRLLAKEIPFYRWFDDKPPRMLTQDGTPFRDQPVVGTIRGFPPAKADKWTGRVRVDLLLTLDPAFDNVQFAIQSKIPDIVRDSTNYFQSNFDPSEKHLKTDGIDRSFNFDLTKELKSTDPAEAHDECIELGTWRAMPRVAAILKWPLPGNVAGLAP